MSTICRLVLSLSLGALTLAAADPIIGTWKMNVAKSKISPGPAPKSVTSTYTMDGDWVVLKTTGVDSDGKPIARNNRVKWDGKQYPYDGPNGRGQIAVTKIDDHTTQSVTTLDGGGKITTRTVISQDGKTRTQTSTGVNSKGQKVNSVAVFDRE
jgi:hypothetical protein